MEKHLSLIGIAVFCSWCAGCGAQRALDLTARTGGSAFLFGQFQAYDGKTGRPLEFADVVRRCRSADVILFGEQHGDAICNQLEAQLLHALLDTDRPIALAMEFFEADTQATLDAYLTDKLDEPAFVEQSKRATSYLGTHRPLIEICRAARVPVLAANAPRRLVRDYRKSNLSYDEYRADLDPEDRQWLPVSSEPLEGPYRDRFEEIMSGQHDEESPETQPSTQPDSQPTSQPTPHAAPAGPTPADGGSDAPAKVHPVSQPVSRPAEEVTIEATSQPAADDSGAMPTGMPANMPAAMPASMPSSMPAFPTWQELFRSQLLWDDAMAESIANFRDRYARHRALLIVGSFHVDRDGGTVIKLRQRRPHDTLATIIYRANEDGQFAFDEEDRGAGDVVIYGLKPPKPEKKPTSMPVEQPETPAAESQPANAPTSMPATGPASAPDAEAAPETLPTSAPATHGMPPHPRVHPNP